jgi:hypothetical protein
MLTKRTFTNRFGRPEAFIYKGQVWDTRLASGEPSDRKCVVCHKHIRFVFILKKTQNENPLAAPEIGKLEIGRCCFHYFRRWNPSLFHALKAALTVELTRARAFEHDKKVFSGHTSVTVRMKQWRQIKRRAMKLTQRMEQSNATAPIATVLGLRAAATREPVSYKRPTTTLHWLEKQIGELQAGISKLSG